MSCEEEEQKQNPNQRNYLIERIQALVTATKTWESIDIVAATQAVPLQPLHVHIPNKLSSRIQRKSFRASQRMQSDATVTVHNIASLVGPRQINASLFHGFPQIINAGLRVVGEQRQVHRPGGGSLCCFCSCSAEGGGGVGSVEPRGEDRAAAAARQLGRGLRGGEVSSGASGLDGVEELFGEVERTARDIGLFGKSGDCRGGRRAGGADNKRLDCYRVRVG